MMVVCGYPKNALRIEHSTTKEVCTLSGKDFKAPDFLQIKGYKYRAKMLIAGAALLVVVIVILSLIIHGIASAVKGAGKPKESDTDVTASVVSSQPAEQPDTTPSEAESSAPVEVKKEKFDADGKLIIDTDTLDGKKAIAITFDDGPGEYTEELVDGLNERGAKATFFMLGSNVVNYPDAVRKMKAGGHQLGNHTYSHSDIAGMTVTDMNKVIAQTDDEIFNVCGERTTAFRPPYGSYTDELAKGVSKTFTLWSLDTLDWKSRNTGKIKNIIVSQAKDGSIILLHDIYKTSVDGALAAIDELKGEGFFFVTVDELMTRYGYPVNPGAHSAQYAVYETNSPHAGEYKEDEEKDKQKDVSSASAGVFYNDRREGSDTDSETESDTESDTTSSSASSAYEEEYEYYDYDEYYYEEEEVTSTTSDSSSVTSSELDWRNDTFWDEQ